ncbi:ribonuclease [Lactiplantibacillus garii]|uniref:Ribonuclease H n=1 Tax=Lactiplantibacillus garii TaxID=2306423 RepID=A0A426DA91_9LACO|nr:ribonuclease H family protein [Lactiplantibacillus garii]RRK11539.1 ribonuclease [Lactiplantibacillus garii]
MAQKYYAVRKGQHPGIYRSWPETQKQVSGFAGAQYKSFTTEAAAQAFMRGETVPTIAKPSKTRSPQTNAPTGRPVQADVTVYTDGGSRNTGNVAGGHVKSKDRAAWAYRIELTDQLVTDSGGEWGATNNRMEIMAFLRALEQLQKLDKTGAQIRFVLDSQYVLNAVTKGWLAGWKRRGWKRSAGPLVNAELWQAVDRLLPQFKHLNFSWTKGHATNQGNVFVDHLLNQTMDRMVPGQAAPTTTATSHHQDWKKTAPTQPASAASKPVDPAVAKKSVDAIRQMLRDAGLNHPG